MTLQGLKEWVKRRLSRKAKQAERSYISEFTVKCTTNCLNHGIQLSEGIWHCRINAMGLHEKGASQCWNNKASVCPLFELKRDVEVLKSDFRKMRPNELAIRWPSLGELIRFDYMLSLVEEPEVETHVESQLHQSGNQLSPSEDAPRASSFDGNVYREYGSGHGNETSENSSSVYKGGKSDERGSESNPGNPARLPLAALEGSRDGKGADRTKV
jgi:hypothetical protein